MSADPRDVLAEHRVDAIEPRSLRYRYPRTVGRNARLGSHGSGGEHSIAVVRTDQGAAGWGLVEGALAPAETYVGRRLDELFDIEVGVVDDVAMPLDFALHDLAGRVLGRPVYDLLGGAGERSIHCYDAAIYLDDLDPDDAPRGVEAVLENCRADHELGFRSFKLKMGRGHRWMPESAGVRRDIEVTRAVRDAFPDAELLVDANDGYTAAGFGGYLDGAADCGLFWVEEPFPETRSDLRTLREHLRRRGSTAMVADGERDPDVPFLLGLAADGLLDVLLMDMVSYGLTRWRQLMPLLRRLDVRASPHAWGLPLKSLYAAQLAAGLGHVVAVEGVPGVTEGVDTSAYRLVDGMLHVPDAPGFGVPLESLEV